MIVSLSIWINLVSILLAVIDVLVCLTAAVQMILQKGPDSLDASTAKEMEINIMIELQRGPNNPYIWNSLFRNVLPLMCIVCVLLNGTKGIPVKKEKLATYTCTSIAVNRNWEIRFGTNWKLRVEKDIRCMRTQKIFGFKVSISPSGGSQYASLKGFTKYTKDCSCIDLFPELFSPRSVSHTKARIAPASIEKYLLDSTTNGIQEKDLMHYEWARYKSFENFPRDAAAMPLRLASAGFFWTKIDDEVECFSCKIRNKGWRPGDVAFEVHKKISPSCLFVTGKDELNVPINDQCSESCTDGACGGTPSSISGNTYAVYLQRHCEETQPGNMCSTADGDRKDGPYNSLPKYPSYSVLRSRLSSYQNWKHHHIQDPKQLADAGFYYAGLSDDVRCFHCGLSLRNWEYGDDPWIVHARFGPPCSYLLQHKQQKPEEVPDTNRSTNSNRTKEVPNTVDTRTSQHAKQLSSHTGSSGGLAALVELGYSTDRIGRTLKRMQQKQGRSDFSPTEIVDAMRADETVNARNKDPSLKISVQNQNAKVTQSASRKLTTTDSLSRTNSNSCVNNGSVNQPSLAEETRELQRQIRCTICLDNDSNVVFLPCGHLISCSECAPLLQNCPICRTRIKGTVKTYMS